MSRAGWRRFKRGLKNVAKGAWNVVKKVGKPIVKVVGKSGAAVGSLFGPHGAAIGAAAQTAANAINNATGG